LEKKPQNEVAQSSSKVEYRALAEVAKEAIWLRNLFEEIYISIERSITIFCDNQSCIKMAKNPIFQGRTKHIEKTCHLIRDHVKKGRISLKFVHSTQQIANILTKPLIEQGSLSRDARQTSIDSNGRIQKGHQFKYVILLSHAPRYNAETNLTILV